MVSRLRNRASPAVPKGDGIEWVGGMQAVANRLRGLGRDGSITFQTEEEYQKALKKYEEDLGYSIQPRSGEIQVANPDHDPLRSTIYRLRGVTDPAPRYVSQWQLNVRALSDQERNKQAQGLYQRSSEQLSRARSTATMQQGVNDALQRSIRGARESTESEASAQAGASGTAEVRLGDGDDATARKGIKQGGRAARRPSGTGGFVGKPARGIRI